MRPLSFWSRAFTALFTTFLSILLPAFTVQAKEEDRSRMRFYGVVEKRPAGLHGQWLIGGRQILTHPQTEFDQVDGPLEVGACVKVDIRRGLVHEIDSEPLADCRKVMP